METVLLVAVGWLVATAFVAYIFGDRVVQVICQLALRYRAGTFGERAKRDPDRASQWEGLAAHCWDLAGMKFADWVTAACVIRDEADRTEDPELARELHMTSAVVLKMAGALAMARIGHRPGPDTRRPSGQ